MRSLKEIFIIGRGPSSSHTMGPSFACKEILEKYPHADKIDVTLYGSLALTGKGHLTDYAIDLELKGVDHTITFDYTTPVEHPNTMDFYIHQGKKKIIKERVISIGGGSIVTSSTIIDEDKKVYPHHNLNDILKYCKKEKITLLDYVFKFEGHDILSYLYDIYDAIEASRSRGIEAKGELPGELHVQRKARKMYLNMRKTKNGMTNIHMNMAVTSFAVAEENASGGIIVIAPTCGSAGVLPGAITYLKMKEYSRKEIVKGLAIAGLIGIIAKTNASVSGAEAGCQAEIGVACAMSAAMVAQVQGLSDNDIAQAAEIAMEHSLGLTCDPVGGYVQIPCIERCAIFALKAVNAATLAKLIPSSDSLVSFDDSIKTMYQTGKDLHPGYRETSIAGLAKLIKLSSDKIDLD